MNENTNYSLSMMPSPPKKKLRPKWIAEIEKERGSLSLELSVTYGGRLGILPNLGL